MARPLNPYVVLLLAIALPGAGHVVVGEPRRGLAFAFFVLLFGVLTYATTTADHSFIGRHAGGLFVWALSIPDAYRRPASGPLKPASHRDIAVGSDAFVTSR